MNATLADLETMNYTDGQLSDQAAHACGLYLDGPEKWEPLHNQTQADMLEQRLGLDVQRPKYKGFGTTCGRYTVFRDDVGEQNRRAVVMAAAEVGRMTPAQGYTAEQIEALNEDYAREVMCCKGA